MLIIPGIVRAQEPDAPAPPPLDPKIVERYLGYYEPDPRILRDVVVTAGIKEGILYMQITGQQAFPVYPKTPTHFASQQVGMDVTFIPPPKGQATRLLIHQKGYDVPAQRVDAKEAARVTQLFYARVKEQRRPRMAVPIDPVRFGNYEGAYRLAANATLLVSRIEDKLFAQLSGQDSHQIFYDGGNEFFYKIVPAQITFVIGADGRAKRLVLHQSGHEIVADKMP